MTTKVKNHLVWNKEAKMTTTDLDYSQTERNCAGAWFDYGSLALLRLACQNANKPSVAVS
jgi:hypothetical protein